MLGEVELLGLFEELGSHLSVGKDRVLDESGLFFFFLFSEL